MTEELLRMRIKKLNVLISEINTETQNVLQNEIGQSAVEYSALLGLFSSVGISIDNPLIAVIIIISIIIVLSVLLVWKLKYFILAVIFLSLLFAGLVYFRR